MTTAIVGGGPGGLYFAALMKQLNPAHHITSWERNAASDTFDFGVVSMSRRFARWSDIDIHFKGRTNTVGAEGFAAISRKGLRFNTMAPPVEELGTDTPPALTRPRTTSSPLVFPTRRPWRKSGRSLPTSPADTRS